MNAEGFRVTAGAAKAGLVGHPRQRAQMSRVEEMPLPACEAWQAQSLSFFPMNLVMSSK